MNNEAPLKLLKNNLNILHNSQDNFLKARLDAAKIDLKDKGITLCADMQDTMLIVDYAAWLYRKRDADIGFPRNLIYRIRNRIISEKVKGGAIAPPNPDKINPNEGCGLIDA